MVAPSPKGHQPQSQGLAQEMANRWVGKRPHRGLGPALQMLCGHQIWGTGLAPLPSLLTSCLLRSSGGSVSRRPDSTT